MARGFLSTINQLSREIERNARTQQRQTEHQLRAQLRAAREAERTQRARLRAAIADEKELKRIHIESRMDDVDGRNEDLDHTVASLETLLAAALKTDPSIDFQTLRIAPAYSFLNLADLAPTATAPQWSMYDPKKPGAVVGLLPWVRNAYDRRLSQAKHEFSSAQAKFEALEQIRESAIRKRRDEHAREVENAKLKATQHNDTIEHFQNAFEAGDPETIATYFSMVLSRSSYPDGFPQTSKAQYQPESQQLVIAYDLPLYENLIPTQKSFKYVKASDTVTESQRPESQRRALYTSVIAQTALRSLHEIFAADTNGKVETVVFNGYVNAIDRGTGKPITPCIVTVRTVRDVFQSIDLAHVDPVTCLKTLNASVSKSAAELAPVRPVLELNMSDPRFITEEDVLSTLDQRPNLMDLSPGEFESLITNLFKTMGLETRQTQASRDGGVDCVAFDPRPIFGGKVVIQAKRYKNTVGVSAVRDLFGTMQNEGASKGILVTTSGYGKAAFQFANGKPIELLAGANLLFLLQEHAGVEAKIVMPDDWKDLTPDE